jgi:hypothetical protein
MLIVMNSTENARLAAREETSEASESIDISLYPVPVTDVLTISVPGKRFEDNVEVTIITVLGQVLHNVKVPAEKIHGYQISTNSIGMGSGVYYLRLQSTNGVRNIKKFTKN